MWVMRERERAVDPEAIGVLELAVEMVLAVVVHLDAEALGGLLPAA